ncbi:MAG: hypothetical protein QOD29_3624 [Alphaproteobacteria bacterium]|nr:hypothetical protein [Alphaproteobacteria bacterium]
MPGARAKGFGELNTALALNTTAALRYAAVADRSPPKTCMGPLVSSAETRSAGPCWVSFRLASGLAPTDRPESGGDGLWAG